MIEGGNIFFVIKIRHNYKENLFVAMYDDVSKTYEVYVKKTASKDKKPKKAHKRGQGSIH
jgi:hypothetical protein